MAASGPGITDIKLLFARSGNRCAFPKCRAPLALNGTLTGEVCHIRGARPGSARFDPAQVGVERHAYENLILMCPIHHTVIDDDEEAYSVDRLSKIKVAHESQSAPIPDAEAAAVAELFVQSVMNVGQSGGLSAYTVNASNITVQSAPSTTHLTHQRQIQAVEHLWRVVRNLSSEFGSVVFIDTILTIQELNAYFRDREYAHIADCVREYSDMNIALRKLANAGANDASTQRPFITHRLWSIFFVLHGIYGRAALLLTNSYKEHRFISWREDRGCDQLLRAILPAQAVEHAKALEIGGLRVAIDYLEGQFLAEAGMNQPRT
ncbi:hypothetical protein LJR090_000436 [Bosea sp. LjRoot90]|uniref:hypothetical protein n=1 Tax=Bosea sp. LjRoot90 TaxID=3342342 RepID=UPI003ECDBD3B